MEPATNPDTQKKEEEVFDLGNFSGFFLFDFLVLISLRLRRK